MKRWRATNNQSVAASISTPTTVQNQLHGKIRDELLDAEVFDTLAEAKVLIEGWRQHHDTARPHSSLRYRLPAPDVLLSPLPPPAAGPEPSGSSSVPVMVHRDLARTSSWGLINNRAGVPRWRIVNPPPS